MRTAIFKNIFLAAMSVFLVGMVCTVGAIYSYFASQQTAALEDREQVEIVRQNFGFDPENGITRVTLDGDQPHYYLEVRKAPAD